MMPDKFWNMMLGAFAVLAPQLCWAEAPEVTYRDSVVEVHLPVSGAEMAPASEADLDEQTRKALRLLSAAAEEHPSIVNLPPYRRREIHDELYVPLGLPNIDNADVEERFIPGPDGYKIRVRIYSPKDRSSEPLPVVMYYHGGGMMMGSLEQYEPIVKRLCEKSGAMIVAVDYRMSPEYKHPTAINDSYTALIWAQREARSFGGDPKKLAVAGDSGGGLLAAVMTQMARDQSGPKLSYQVLIYPAVGMRGDSKSMDLFASGYVFGREELEWAYGSWIHSPDQLNDPTVSPILADNFSNLPPAYVVSAEYEVMRDDIEDYAGLLSEAGVPTVLRRFDGTVHPFVSMAGVIDAGKVAIDDAAAHLRQAFEMSPR